MIDEAGILMAETIMVLSPHMRGQQVIERCDGPAPRDVVAYLQPFSVLVEHRVDDMNKSLVTREKTMPARQEVAFEPTLALVLAQHFHDAAVGGELVIEVETLRVPGPVSHIEHVLPAVRIIFVWTEQAKILTLEIELHYVTQVAALNPGSLSGFRPRLGYFYFVGSKVRQS